MLKVKKQRGMLICLLFFIFSVITLLPSKNILAASSAVVPINWSSFTGGNPTDTDSLRVKQWLLNANKYGASVWYDTVKNFDAQTGTYLDFGGTAEANIRYPAMEAFGLAISIKTGIYDPAVTGVTLADAKTKTLKMIKSLGYRHKSNISGGWGDAWQSAHWAFMAAYAGWMMWSDLSATDQEYLRKMIEYESNRFNNYAVPYYRDRAGNIIYSGDSKIEENVWNADAIALAACMMPNHQNYNIWMSKVVELFISATARPQDINSTEMLHGKTVGQWLNGSNIETNGAVINHGIIHPIYMAINDMIEAQSIFRMALKDSPLACKFNVKYLYQALVDVDFPSPPYNSPGGTLYRDGSYTLYYPQGSDWGTEIYDVFSNIDIAARAFGYDELVAQKGSYWEPLHVQKNLDQQNRFTDGHTYLSSAENSYGGREEAVAQRAGWAYLTKWIANQGPITYTNINYAAPTATPTPGPANLALNKPVTCSSQQTGNEAPRAVDGDTGTRWSADTFPEWIQVDLGATYSINKTELVPYLDRAYRYKIEVSTDGATYTQVVDRTANTQGGSLLTDAFTARNARYVKLTVTGVYNDSTTWTSILEFRVFSAGATPTPTPTPTSNPTFQEGFENGFSNWSVSYGTPSTSTVKVHSGSYSFVMNEDTDAIYRDMGSSLNKKVDVWFYDDAADTSMVCVANAENGTSPSILGVNTTTSTTKYIYRFGTSWYATSITRTTGWHKFTFDFTSGTDVKLSIDGTQVVSSTINNKFNWIKLGDFWISNTGTVYFDDVSVY